MMVKIIEGIKQKEGREIDGDGLIRMALQNLYDKLREKGSDLAIAKLEGWLKANFEKTNE